MFDYDLDISLSLLRRTNTRCGFTGSQNENPKNKKPFGNYQTYISNQYRVRKRIKKKILCRFEDDSIIDEPVATVENFADYTLQEIEVVSL